MVLKSCELIDWMKGSGWDLPIDASNLCGHPGSHSSSPDQHLLAIRTDSELDDHFDVEETRPPLRQSLGNPFSPVSERSHRRTLGRNFGPAGNGSDLGLNRLRQGFRKGHPPLEESPPKGSQTSVSLWHPTIDS